MSYKRPPTVLIARQGYSNYEGVGAEKDRAAATSYCGQKYGITSKDMQPCVDFYVAGKSGDYAPSSSGSSGVLSTILSGAGTFLSGLFKPSTPAPVVVAPQSTTPDWLMPVAIGGIGLVAVLLITKKRSNPARRRRHRR